MKSAFAVFSSNKNGSPKTEKRQSFKLFSRLLNPSKPTAPKSTKPTYSVEKFYTSEELKEKLNNKNFDGIKPQDVEYYLTDKCFEKVFEMTKDEFYLLPKWKQTNKKRDSGFF